MHCDDAERLADALLDERRVVWVQMRAPYQTFNRWSVPSMLYEKGGDQRALPARTTLRGSGQLIAISDTGVETTNCLFKDSANRNVPLTRTQTVPIDTHHEVMRAYWSGTDGDFHDLGNGAGHGSHVCGTAVGRSLATTTKDYSGGAPAARLVFIDLLPMNGGDFLQVPTEIDATLFQFSYDCGAMVHSASWGSQSYGVYGEDEADVDAFCYKNRRFLPVFAAGNAGPDLGTIASPAYAKNALAIGSAMNGAAAYSLAGVDPRAPDDFSNDWLSDFSSTGSALYGIMKPDVVGYGGDFVWSANADAPAGTACSDAATELTGMAGTSMATPRVCRGAVFVGEYFQSRLYPNTANVSSAGDVTDPMASLVRAMIIASAVPLRGVFPHQLFKSAADRINRSGFGRVVLRRVLEQRSGTPNVQTVELSNERADLGIAEGQSVLWCMELLGRVTAQDQVTVAMSYTDYPSSPLARTTLVNDLRLEVLLDWSVLTVNELPRGNTEKRSVNERVTTGVGGPTVLSVRVVADDIGFGQVQTFSLIVIVNRGNGSTLLVANIAPPVLLSVNSTEVCARCKPSAVARTVYIPKSWCSQCGNGVVESATEQCDGTECCDPSTCRVLNDSSPCSVMVNDCRVQGTCQGAAKLCVADASIMYVNSNDGASKCQPVSINVSSDSVSDGTKTLTPVKIDSDNNAPGAVSAGCTTMSVAQWRAALLVNRAPASDVKFCCVPLWSVFDMIRFEPLFVDLAQEYAAALLNSMLPGVGVNAVRMMQIAATREFLEQFCTTGLLTVASRSLGSQTLIMLQMWNKPCATWPAEVQQNAQCTPSSNAKTTSTLSALFCSNGAGVYDARSHTCQCNNDRHQAEANCAHLSCSGNGVSIYNPQNNTDSCACHFGWAGAMCEKCASSPRGSNATYHCIGVLQAALGEAPQRHYLDLVLRSTVAARLTGQFYGTKTEKVADGVPGAAGLDCWCREPSEVIAGSSLATHQESVALAQKQYERMLLAKVIGGTHETVSRASSLPNDERGAAAREHGQRHSKKSSDNSMRWLPVMENFASDEEVVDTGNDRVWQQQIATSKADRRRPLNAADIQILVVISLAFVRRWI